MTLSDLDEVLLGLHRDKLVTISEQLLQLERDIAHRRLIGAEHTARLFEHIEDLTTDINRLLPEHALATDPHRVIRQGLERERRELQREITDELIHRWRDLERLKAEQRTLARERNNEILQYEQHHTNYQ